MCVPWQLSWLLPLVIAPSADRGGWLVLLILHSEAAVPYLLPHVLLYIVSSFRSRSLSVIVCAGMMFVFRRKS